MPALRYSSDHEPGYTRRHRGRGWRYLDPAGSVVTDDRVIARLDRLVIPPAWRDVWICRSSRGHLQATGRDDAGRKQYLYHPRWREEREREKYQRILQFAERLPALRRVVARDLRHHGVDRSKALATAVAILDRTHLRVGGEEYASGNGSYGLATVRSRHLTVDDDTVVFDFTGKGGTRQQAEIRDARIARIVAEMDDMPGYEVLKYRDADGTVVDVRSEDVNAYIKEHVGDEFSAKDFRTWAGTVAAAVALAEVGPVEGSRARRRAVTGVVKAVAAILGNTPAVCRASYIDPRVIDHFLDGVTIDSLRQEVDRARGGERGPNEVAVLALLRRGLRERAEAA
jgi:DNA topoisomerase-1